MKYKTLIPKALLLTIVTSLAVATVSLLAREENLLKPLTDLRQDGSDASNRKIPLLIAFTAEHCPFCETVKEEFLHPMERGGLYTDKVIMREADLDSYAEIIAFGGKQISVAELGNLYGIEVTPTLIFVDSKGMELAERLVGIRTVDYYGGFLDDAIDQSIDTLNR